MPEPATPEPEVPEPEGPEPEVPEPEGPEPEVPEPEVPEPGVMDMRHARLDLGHDAGAPRIARRFVSRLLEGWGVPSDAVERCQLLVSELVSNAVLHGEGPVELSITEIDARNSVYRIEVCNGGEGSPAMKRAGKHDLSGRGLRLVDMLSRGWGSATEDGTTRVWFELHAGVAS